MPPRGSGARGRGRGLSSEGPWRRGGRANADFSASASAPGIKNNNDPATASPVKPSSSEPRDFEFVASVSRSSGLDKDGDTLKDDAVQVEYEAYIRGKLDEYWRRFPADQRSEDAETVKHRKEVEGNLLIKLRKLREGISSSKRTDSFATEVYETSLYLSILFRSTTQLPSLSSHLLSHLYATQPNSSTSWTTTLLVLHALASHNSSQKHFYDARRDLPKRCQLDSKLDAWTLGLARSLHRHDTARFEALSRPSAVLPLLPERKTVSEHGPDIAVAALEELLRELREQARRAAWTTLRTSYREFAPATHAWIARALLFDVALPKERDAFDAWIAQCKQRGEIADKAGVANHWVVKTR